MSNTQSKIERIKILDLIRGIAIIGVVIVHTLFDVPIFFPHSEFANTITLCYNSPIFQIISSFGAGLFVFICGVCMAFSKSNIKRGIKLLLISLIISIATYIFAPEEFIVFGILHCLAVCILIAVPIKKHVERINPLIIFAISAIMIVASVYATNHFNPIDVNYLFPLGFYGHHFRSGDYYPLLPWFFIFISGVAAANPIAERKLPTLFYKITCSPIEWIGKKSLWIYLIQQPLAFGIFYLIRMIIG